MPLISHQSIAAQNNPFHSGSCIFLLPLPPSAAFAFHWKMARLNMSGWEPLILRDIKNEVRQGGNVTHILNLKVTRPRTPDEGDLINHRIYQLIANTPQFKDITGTQITITWRTSATRRSAYYHCNSGLFNDVAVHAHTQALVKDIIEVIDGEFEQVISRGISGVVFLVCKPLSRSVPLIDDDITL
jgi:hypothetical protein